jgi:hypothetical protein
MLFLAVSIYFLQGPALYFILIGFCIVLFLLVVYHSRRISYGLKRFHIVLNSSLNPIHVTDGNGVTRYANPAFLQWSGMNKNGVRVASGVYFYRLLAGDYVSTKKMVMLK